MISFLYKLAGSEIDVDQKSVDAGATSPSSAATTVALYSWRSGAVCCWAGAEGIAKQATMNAGIIRERS